MGFVRIFWKNNVQEAYLPKMSISGQIVSEIAQLCFFGPTQKKFRKVCMEFSKDILTNPIISEISFLWHHYSLVKSNRRSTHLTGHYITAKLNECKTKTFSQKTVQKVLHSEGCKRRLAIKKMQVVREANRKKRVKLCKERRGRTVDDYWKKVIFSSESQIVLCTNNRVYI